MNTQTYFLSTLPSQYVEDINFYKLIWIFMLGCFLGYIVEMIWCYLKNGYFESRKGVIYGPLSPVYGFGSVIFTILLYKFQHANGLIIFIASAIIGGLFEYICSLVQEKTIGTISWEYSNAPLNIHGRTSGLYCFYWGILGLIFLRHTLPYCNNLIEKIPNHIEIFCSYFFIIFMSFDLLISALAVKRKTNRHHNIPCKNSLDEFLDKYYTDDFLNKIYPNMRVISKNK